MTFLGAYKSFWKNYFNFKGKATRKEYWFVVLWNCIIMTPLLIGLIVSSVNFIFRNLSPTKVAVNSGSMMGIFVLIALLLLYALATFIPNVSIVVRRFHDVGISRWWYGGPYILTVCCSLVSELIKVSDGLDLVIATISLVSSVGALIVTMLPTDKLKK